MILREMQELTPFPSDLFIMNHVHKKHTLIESVKRIWQILQILRRDSFLHNQSW